MGMDYGASHHMSSDSLSFTYMFPSPFIPVMTADGTLMPLADVGFVVTPHLSLSNVYFIPKLRLNLASVGQLCDSGDYLVIFSSFFFVVYRICNLKR
jgi:hypothetical protein